MTRDHIVQSFSVDLRRLNAQIVEMGGLAEAQIESAVRAVVRRDASLASGVVRSDARLDQHEREVNAQAIRMLALRQPVAGDLREIVSALKIATDLERIGDYGTNIAQRALVLAQVPGLRPVGAVSRMGRLAQEIVREVLDAYIDRDLDKAVAVWQRDQELGDIYTSLFREVLTDMMEDPRNISAFAHLLFIARNLEHVGDHATSIAETIHFLVTGRPVQPVRSRTEPTADPLTAGDDHDIASSRAGI